MADQSVLFKHGAKEIAWLNGYGLTFMAKPDHTWTGSSGHLHMSLWDKSGKQPLFHDARAKPYGMSTTMRHFLGGMMKFCPRAGHLLGAERQLLQALRGGVMGPGQRRLGSGQPDDRLPDRGRRGRPAYREPLPRRRHEPVPHLRRGGRRRAAGHRARDRAAGRVPRQRLRGHRLRPHAAGTPRGDSRAGGQPRPRSTSSGQTSWPTTSTRPASSRSSTTRSSIPGTASATSSAAEV